MWVTLSKDCWSTETKYCEKELGLTKFEIIYEFKSIIRHYGLEHRWRAISKQETRRWCDITTRLVPLNVQRATLAPYVRTYVRRGFFLRQAPRGENGDQAAWENTVQILGEKWLPQLTLTTTCGLDILALEQLTNRQWWKRIRMRGNWKYTITIKTC